ncbi:hypothetical protein N7540_012746 [Penicillium herquei]|nr:hypothetical protein N7540_012746 [Penicillium herquei]
MARHGHRHSRVDRMMSAKHHMEAIEDDEELGESLDVSAPNIQTVGTIQNPLSPPDPLSSKDLCSSSSNITCLKNLADSTEDLLARRQAETTSAATVQTVVQVVDTDSQTLWQSSGTEFPMTVSNSVFGEITFSGSSVSTLTNSTMATPTASLSTTPSNNSTSTQSTATSKQRIPASSPRVFPVTGAQASSTPLISVASTTTTSSTTSSPPNNFYYPSSTSTTFTFTFTGPPTSSSSTNSYWSSTTQSSSSSTHVYGGAVQTGTGSSSGNGDGSGSSTNSGSSGSGSSISPTTSKIVGGVVGSVAGLALLIFCVFYFLRRKGYLQNFMKGKGTQTLPSSDMGAAGSMETAERDGHSNPFNAAYLAPAFMKRWRQSTMTTATESTIDSGSSERGFQKISGRKIPPVLTHGGDGYGGGLGGDSPTIPDCLIGISPTSPTGGPLSSLTTHGPPPTSPFGSPLDATYTREAEETLAPLRPSRVHLPVSSSVNFGIATTVTPSHPIAQPQSAMPLPRPDALGRSHLDGSRGSRFTESL